MSKTKPCLIIFTRYPEAGKTKTRLIPALGAEGAATLQRQMTEYAIAQSKTLSTILVEVHFTGGNLELMQQWLGTDLTYKLQVEGDIGLRMLQAFQSAFLEKNRVIIIGTDCPDLDNNIINKAFQLLDENELVLGSALDGGYYLIGLQRLIPELFQGISWSTSAVLKQTVEIAERLSLSIAYLPKLRDIDRPEDLEYFNAKERQE